MSPLQLSVPVSRTDGTALGLLAECALDVKSPIPLILERARAQVAKERLGYAGNVTPAEAFELITAGVARLIDVRTPEERKFVGYVPDSVAVPWATGTAFTRNPRFIRELEGKVRKDDVLLFFCRSGARCRAQSGQRATGYFCSA